MNFIGKVLGGLINFFTARCCPTWNCTQEDLDKMMVKKGYRKGYAGTWIKPGDIVLDDEYRA